MCGEQHGGSGRDRTDPGRRPVSTRANVHRVLTPKPSHPQSPKHTTQPPQNPPPPPSPPHTQKFHPPHKTNKQKVRNKP